MCVCPYHAHHMSCTHGPHMGPPLCGMAWYVLLLFGITSLENLHTHMPLYVVHTYGTGPQGPPFSHHKTFCLCSLAPCHKYCRSQAPAKQQHTTTCVMMHVWVGGVCSDGHCIGIRKCVVRLFCTGVWITPHIWGLLVISMHSSFK
jgi:hypothetical protein